ncbi:MAG: ABC transporter permease [Phycisphaerales bacterium]|nr:MAG: ABC transporter permease [Phycisphaerales bacterium]
MRAATYHRRSLSYHWRTNLSVVLAAVVGTAALTGALLVGDSVRGSLREQALVRLGSIDHALIADRFFRERLANDLLESAHLQKRVAAASAAILLRGGVAHADSGRRVNRISILGVDERFWGLASTPADNPDWPDEERIVALNEPLASELSAQPSDTVLLRVGTPVDIPTETLLGRRDDTSSTLRLTVRAIISSDGLGSFDAHPQQRLPRNAFVPLATLQRAIGRPGAANAVLVAYKGADSNTDFTADLQAALAECLTLEDLGLRLRENKAHEYLSLESDRLLIEPPVEAAARAAAQKAGLRAGNILAYLANSIEVESTAGDQDEAVPYSVVAAIDPQVLHPDRPMRSPQGSPVAPPEPGRILLNEWAADELNADIGDRVRLTYYLTGPRGRLDTASHEFELTGIVALSGPAADPGFTPDYPGITDATRLADWDPPFPIDLSRIRDRDEEYWDEHRATPKAFVHLAEGQSLWISDEQRFGRLTSMRFYPARNQNLASAAQALRSQLLNNLKLSQLGLRFDAVRKRALDAGRGSIDFGGMFIGFSFFLIISAAMLVALTFRLGMERRAGEIGLLLAVGFTPKRVARMLLGEGAAVAAIGAVVGTGAGLAYAWLMLAGLRSWWSDAVSAPFLRLHAPAASLIIGLFAGFLIATASAAWALRGLTRASPRALLAGAISAGVIRGSARRARAAWIIAVGAFLAAGGLAVASVGASATVRAAVFFGSGAALLIACIAALAAGAARSQPSVIRPTNPMAVTRLGVRNASRHPGRSLLTVGLIASAVFVIVAIGAFRLKTGDDPYARSAGTGGFAVLAEAAVPLQHDLNIPEGRQALGLAAEDEYLHDVHVYPFRLRPGDEASCLNLYRPTAPRIIGATEEFVCRGGFTFADSVAETDTERENPWLLLRKQFDDGAVPVIGDQDTVMWQLHLGLSQDLTITDERGRAVPLRFVGVLKGSVLAGELIVAEDRFLRLFPSTTGYGYFLIETPPDGVGQLEERLEAQLADYGFDATSTVQRLREYHAIQNTYLSTFQTLGGLGLVLGTLGMAAVLLRNVWERRSEMALLRALGFRRSTLGWLVLAENGALLLAGLAVGCASALLAILPQLLTAPREVPWGSLALTLVLVLATGMLSGLAALRPALRTPLLPALRSE